MRAPPVFLGPRARIPIVSSGHRGHSPSANERMAQWNRMTPRAITIRLAEPRDAPPPGPLRGGAGNGAGGPAAGGRGAITGFAIMEFGDERAHLVLLAVR